MDLRERRRLAIGLMLVGGVLLALSVTTAANRKAEQRRMSVKRASDRASAAPPQIDRPKLLRDWLLVAGGLVIVFLVATLAMARLRRRLLTFITGRPARPTPSGDVWRMHKPPDEPPEELYEQGADGETED